MAVSQQAAWLQANGVKPNEVGDLLVPKDFGAKSRTPKPRVAGVVGSVRNPKPDPRSLSRSPLHPGDYKAKGYGTDGLFRGYMVSSVDKKGKGSHRVDFLWNPHTINFSYNIDARIGSQADTNTLGAGVGCDFELVFDRQFEVMGAPHSNRGVLEDLNALEALAGLSRNNVASNAPVQVRFGGPLSVSFAGKLYGLSVSLTHFTPDMRPTRAVVAVTLLRETLFDGAEGGLLLQQGHSNFGDSSSGSDGGTDARLREQQRRPVSKPKLPKLKNTGAGTYNFLTANVGRSSRKTPLTKSATPGSTLGLRYL